MRFSLSRLRPNLQFAGYLIPLAQSFHSTGQSRVLTIIVAMKNTGNVFLLVDSTPYTTASALNSAFYGITAFGCDMMLVTGLLFWLYELNCGRALQVEVI